eukprot:1176393-Prorocentrum_minimum.AAC.7
MGTPPFVEPVEGDDVDTGVYYSVVITFRSVLQYVMIRTTSEHFAEHVVADVVHGGGLWFHMLSRG